MSRYLDPSRFTLPPPARVPEIDSDHCLKTPDGWSTEASDICLEPGEWPETIVVDDMPFTRAEKIDAGEEFGGYVYRRAALRLYVYND